MGVDLSQVSILARREIEARGLAPVIKALIQEMGREINTIGSKSGDAGISRSVIEIKSELAKLREQVQNIE